MAGTLCGALILGALADKYGRRKIWYISFTGLVIFGFASSFAPTYKIYTLLRFLTGFWIGGEILSAFVLATELIGPSYRGFAGTMAQCFFTTGLLILPIVAYLVRDWRTLSVLLSLPFCVFILFFRWVEFSFSLFFKFYNTYSLLSVILVSWKEIDEHSFYIHISQQSNFTPRTG